MNEQETSHKTTAAPFTAGDIPGVARVQPLPSNKAAALARTPNTLLGDLVSGLLGLVARVLNPSLLGTTLGLAKKVGHYAVLIGGALTIAYAIYGAIKFNSFSVFVTGIGFVVGLAVAQFAAIRFLGAADTLIASTPSRISSSAFVECAGLLVLLFAVSTFLGGVAGAVVSRSIVPLIPAILGALALTCFGAVALHPSTVNVATGEGTAGEEAIGLLSFFFKSGLKLVPLFFALLSVAGALALVLSFFGESGAFASVAQSLVNILPLPVNVPPGLAGSALIAAACLVPIAGYFIFLLQYLIVDVLRAILCVPGKLDALRR